MTDVVDKATRSRMMSGIRGDETYPERVVRSYLFKHAFRFRKNVRELPGKPDVVLPKYRTIVFVHGCFWHRHPRCRLATVPKTNPKFWEQKLNATRKRDLRDQRRLRALGWQVLTIWECQLDERHLSRLAKRIAVMGHDAE